MAFMDQTKKAKLAPAIKAILKKYNVKGSIAVRHHSTLVVNLKSGKLDLIANYKSVSKNSDVTDSMNVNEYCLDRQFDGKSLSFMKELYAACMSGNHDNSDIQSDYFDVGWYVNIKVGQWNNPYEVTV